MDMSSMGTAAKKITPHSVPRTGAGTTEDKPERSPVSQRLSLRFRVSHAWQVSPASKERSGRDGVDDRTSMIRIACTIHNTYCRDYLHGSRMHRLPRPFFRSG